MSGVLKAIGIGSLVGIAIAIVSNFKSLINIVNNIIKVISYILKPIADVVMVLLMPILMILKPIMQIANQIMAPFIKLSMQVMREGMKMMASGNVAGGMAAMGAAGGIAMAGFNSVIVGLLGGLVKIVIDISAGLLNLALQGLVAMMFNMFGGLMSFFGVNVEELQGTLNNSIENIITTGADLLKLNIDASMGTIMNLFALQAATIGEAFGVSTVEFQKVATQNIKDMFPGTEGIQGVWDGAWTAFRKNGVQTISDAVKAFNDEMSKLNKKSSGKDWNVMLNEANQQSVDLRQKGAHYTFG